MKILLSYIHYPVCSGRYVKDALMRLGHDVKSCGWSTENTIWGMQVHPKHNHYPDAPIDGAIEGWTPDLVILMDSAYTFHHPVYGDVPHVVYGVDNHVRDYRQDGMTHYFVAHKSSSLMDMKADDVTWLPCGFDPEAFTPSDIEMESRDYDVTLVGVLYESRVRMLEAMAQADLDVFAGTGLLYEDYAQAYQNSRFALNVSVKGDLNQRIFETAALGCVVLTQPIPDLELIDYPKDQILTYKTCKGAIEMVRKFSPTPLDLAWLQAHTWDARIQVVIDWYQTTCEKKATKRAKTDA
jgi:hypothetical protein